MIKLQFLSDNRKVDDIFETEHGLSVYLETDEYKCLLDTGASDIYIRNAQKLGIDLAEVDYVFISHGHIDHIGGLASFFKINTKAQFIISENALDKQFFSKRNGLKKISSEFDFSEYKDRFITVHEKLKLERDINVFATTCSSNAYPKANDCLFKMMDGELVNDDFDHELVVTFGTNFLMVYTGCAHKGLLNMLDSIEKEVDRRVTYVVGGFYLLDSTDQNNFETEQEISELAQQLRNNYQFTDFITGHCTGENVYKNLKSVLDEHLHQFYAGLTYIV